jgi:hypothetical protein
VSPSGSFNDNEAVSWDSGASTGYLAGNVLGDLTFQLHVLTGSVPGDTDTILGGVTAATIDISGTPVADQDFTTSVTPLLSKGPAFYQRGNAARYAVASVTNDYTLELTGNFAGAANEPNQEYVVHTSFSSPDNVPYPELGDVETASVAADGLLALAALMDTRRPAILSYGISTLSADGYLDHAGIATAGTNEGAPMMRGGSIVGLAGRLEVDTETTPGTIDIEVHKNGAVVLSGQITTSGTGWYGVQATQARGVDTFVAGDRIQVNANFGTFVGTVAPVLAGVEVALSG